MERELGTLADFSAESPAPALPFGEPSSTTEPYDTPEAVDDTGQEATEPDQQEAPEAELDPVALKAELDKLRKVQRSEASYKGRFEQERQRAEAAEKARQEHEQRLRQIETQLAESSSARQAETARQQYEQVLARRAAGWRQQGYDDLQVEGWIAQERMNFERQQEMTRQQEAQQRQLSEAMRLLQQQAVETDRRKALMDTAETVTKEAQADYGVAITVTPEEVLREFQTRYKRLPMTSEEVEAAAVRVMNTKVRAAQNGTVRRTALRQAATNGTYQMPGDGTPAPSYKTYMERWGRGEIDFDTFRRGMANAPADLKRFHQIP